MKMQEGLKIRGFLRIRIGEDMPNGQKKIVGDSGWVENQIVNLGWKDYIFGLMAADAGSRRVARAILGTGGVPASNATAIPGETARSTTIDVATSGSFSLRFTTNFPSGADKGTIDVAGLIYDTASAGTILCGKDFTGSACASNQAVSLTYMLST